MIYVTHVFPGNSRRFEDVPEGIDLLCNAGVRSAVLTNGRGKTARKMSANAGFSSWDSWLPDSIFFCPR
jgi:phosphoglycolate phosphatase-like HAD superfamily hydrolase